jgi:hypothetical protein
MSATPTPGQIAYAAYVEDYWPGHCPPYERLGRDEQRAWEAAAQAVLGLRVDSSRQEGTLQEGTEGGEARWMVGDETKEETP